MKNFNLLKIILFFLLFFLCECDCVNGSNIFSWIMGFSSSNKTVAVSNVRKPRFNFFKEFIEPLPSVLNDMFPSPTSSDPIVNTTNGFVRGVIKRSRDGRNYFAFLGIPYAKPPVMELRFEPPQKLEERWDGIMDAVKYASPCFHLDLFFTRRLKGKEDCLYTNIYTPKITKNANLPVMVYIHGGGFNTGSGDFYQGKYFMDHEVVLVVFNYRLAALGFLNTEDGLVRGNMGLKDQVILLRWVQENIQEFGGNPYKVTLFGESAGAAMAQYHLFTPQSKGLVHKVISLSGSALGSWTINSNPSESAKRLAKKAGCPVIPNIEMVKCLKTVPVENFKAEYKEMTKTIFNPAEFFAPTLETLETDDTFMTKSPREMMKSGNYSKAPVMQGVSSMEGLLFTSRILVDKYAMENMDRKFESWMPRYFYYNPEDTNRTELLRSYYFQDRLIDPSNPTDFMNLTNLLADGSFNFPSHQFAKLYSSKDSPVFMFYNGHKGRFSTFDILKNLPSATSESNLAGFQVVANLLSEMMRYQLTNKKTWNFGPCHGDTILLLFNMRNMPGIGRMSMDYETSYAFVKAVVDFASSEKGEPIFYNENLWPEVDPFETLPYMETELPGRVVPEPFKTRMEFWETNLVSN